MSFAVICLDREDSKAVLGDIALEWAIEGDEGG